MKRELAQYLTMLVSDDLDIPSFVSEKLEVNFKKENFEEIYMFVWKRQYLHRIENLVKGSDEE